MPDDPHTRPQLAQRLVHIRCGDGGVYVEGLLKIPAYATGIVLFAHGSGSSRRSPRNRTVVDVLHQVGLATLLMDLLSPEEDCDHMMRFDIGRLVMRLEAALDWVQRQPETHNLVPGLFGASTGAAAALRLAAKRAQAVRAVVSRGGRPDLAGTAALKKVRAPTLLIVGGNDPEVITLNEQAASLLACEKELAVVAGATHLFEERGALAEVARLAARWFVRWLTVPSAAAQ
jgi:pimeloyl-ACP methyl ester carboxylesterase